MDGPFFETTFINKSENDWRVFEKGRDLHRLKPGETARIESWKPTTDFARWSRIVREKDGRLTLTENPQWQSPWKDHYCLELLNVDASSEESISCLLPNPAVTTAAAYLHAQLGWPVIYPLNLWDPLVKYSKIIWRKREVRKPIEGTKYFRTVMELVKECVPRSKAELKQIFKERAAIETKKLAEASEKIMKENERLLEEQ